MTGGSNNCTGKVQQHEAAEEPPQDHKSDQEESEGKKSSSEVNQRADRLEFIREFQEIIKVLNKDCRICGHTYVRF